MRFTSSTVLGQLSPSSALCADEFALVAELALDATAEDDNDGMLEPTLLDAVLYVAPPGEVPLALPAAPKSFRNDGVGPALEPAAPKISSMDVNAFTPVALTVFALVAVGVGAVALANDLVLKSSRLVPALEIPDSELITPVVV